MRLFNVHKLDTVEVTLNWRRMRLASHFLTNLAIWRKGSQSRLSSCVCLRAKVVFHAKSPRSRVLIGTSWSPGDCNVLSEDRFDL